MPLREPQTDVSHLWSVCWLKTRRLFSPCRIFSLCAPLCLGPLPPIALLWRGSVFVTAPLPLLVLVTSHKNPAFLVRHHKSVMGDVFFSSFITSYFHFFQLVIAAHWCGKSSGVLLVMFQFSSKSMMAVNMNGCLNVISMPKRLYVPIFLTKC